MTPSHATLPEPDALAAIAARRQASTPFDHTEIMRRVEELGDMQLDSAARHGAFAELYAAYAPLGFRFVPFPDHCTIASADHKIALRAVIIDDAVGQVVAEITRSIDLDNRVAGHDWLRIQNAYRGDKISYVLLKEAFPLYRQIGLSHVAIHAALETGRWHWARLGFDFLDDDERLIVLGWGTAALLGMGKVPIAPAAPARRLAQLGTGSPPETASMAEVRDAAARQIAAWAADPNTKAVAHHLQSQWDSRSRVESNGAYGIFDDARLHALAASNGHSPTDQMDLGKAIMLTGPDWYGTFDLNDAATVDAFEREFSRKFATP